MASTEPTETPKPKKRTKKGAMAALRRARLAKSDSRAHAHAREVKEGDAAAFWVRRDSLKPWKRNPRENQGAIDEVVESIKAFGFGAPIVARQKDREIIAGHTRVLAAEVLGMELVPVRWLDLEVPKAHLLALADNKLGEISEWVPEELANILSDYGLEDAKLAGFDEDELDSLALKLAPDEGEIAGPVLGGLEYKIIIDCEDETAQRAMLERFAEEGLHCRPLIS
jgi:ParB family chromosome partitioning protein